MKVGNIKSIWRFPIKSFAGEKLNQGQVNRHGILGDRAYALFDEENGKIVNAIHYKLYPEVLKCHASFIEPPEDDQLLPPVKITLADGTNVNSNSQKINHILSDFLRRKVKFITINKDDKSIHKNSISLITTSTLKKLSKLSPESDFDERRFRMNLLIDTQEQGFVEDAWVGKKISIGQNTRLNITKPDPRCPIITLSQDGLNMDVEILKTIVNHNTIYVEGKGNRPCAGVYAEVRKTGLIKVYDIVSLIQ